MAELTAQTETLGQRYHFLIRRLHSLSGIIPVGVFLCIHLTINATIMIGGEAFQNAVSLIHSLNKIGILPAVELLFIIAPIAFHALVGILIWLTGSVNVLQHRYCGNARYTLQRWSGIIAIFFIVAHLWHIHWILPWGAEFDAHAAPASTIAAMASGWTAPVYAIGVICAVFHFANGLWTFLITWGITISPKSQRGSAWVCGLIGLVLLAFGLGALVKLKVAETPVEPAATHVTEGHVADSIEDADLLL